jgi:NAD(P)-dependent dehydrogenase (short-subunit alcohol dehydrogenase family)
VTGELAGKVAIVTGAASGIGLGTAGRFVQEGARVVIADVDRDAGEAAAAELGANVAFKLTDVSDPAQVTELVMYAVTTFGGLHIMFNNAGISGARHASLFEDDFGDFHHVMGVNLLGVMVGTREAGRHMADHGGGSIINITSIGGMQPAPSLWTYHTSKASVIMFSQSAALDLGQYGIRVNCIAPGNIDTPILERSVAGHLPEEERAEHMAKVRAFLLSRQALSRQGTTSDLAEVALFFASERSSYVTGTVLPVDGGMVVGTPSKASELRIVRGESSS